jgi:hypothetical protein
LDILTAASEVLRVRLDTPYRLLASLLGCAAVATLVGPDLGRPSAAVAQAADWFGLDVSGAIDAWSAWLATDGRAEVIADASGVLVWLSLAAVGSLAARSTSPARWRASATVWVALALYLEARGDRFAATWAVLGLVILVWGVVKAGRQDGEDVMLAALDLMVALGYAALLPLVWSMSTEPPRHPPASSAVQSAGPVRKGRSASPARAVRLHVDSIRGIRRGPIDVLTPATAIGFFAFLVAYSLADERTAVIVFVVVCAGVLTVGGLLAVLATADRNAGDEADLNNPGRHTSEAK